MSFAFLRTAALMRFSPCPFRGRNFLEAFGLPTGVSPIVFFAFFSVPSLGLFPPLSGHPGFDGRAPPPPPTCRGVSSLKSFGRFLDVVKQWLRGTNSSFF